MVAQPPGAVAEGAGLLGHGRAKYQAGVVDRQVSLRGRDRLTVEIDERLLHQLALDGCGGRTSYHAVGWIMNS